RNSRLQCRSQTTDLGWSCQCFVVAIAHEVNSSEVAGQCVSTPFEMPAAGREEPAAIAKYAVDYGGPLNLESANWR
ncbi:MAG: hypothetical protein ABL893_18640, partial [Hyphomicrobium sp.]